MISERMRDGITLACRRQKTSIKKAAAKAKVNAGTIYNFMNEDTNIRVKHLETFCVEGLGMSFDEVYKLGAR